MLPSRLAPNSEIHLPLPLSAGTEDIHQHTQQGIVLTICHFSLDVKLQRIQKSLQSNIYGDEAKQAEESLYDDSTYYENAYTKQFTRLTPDSMFGM
jgi:hypothetical protein